MNNQIEREYVESLKFNFEFLPDDKLLKLSIDNVALVEAMIRADSKYCRSFDKKAESKGKYGGSIAYWMTQLRNYYESSENLGDKEFQEIIEGAVSAVDRENSTHLESDKNKGGGRDAVVRKLMTMDKACIYNSLKNRTFTLFEKILEKSSNQKGTRKNPSFASKFCHYACMYLFEGMKEQDNFSIYDGVLCKVIPKYAMYYGVDCGKKKIECKNENDYKYYSDLIDEILKKSGNNISRNGFDHLLWYYYKGRV